MKTGYDRLFTRLGLSIAVLCTGASVPSTGLAFSEGVGSSGGGYAVVCRSASGVIQSAEVLDLYEARLEGRTLIPGTGVTHTDYAQVVWVYRRLTGDYRPIDHEVMNHFRQLKDLVILLKKDEPLPPANDLGETPASVPSGCEIEQLAYFQDQQRRLWIQEEIWNALDSLNQAALLHHEVIYHSYRIPFKLEGTSRNVRKIVGQLFSTNPGAGIHELLGAQHIGCWADLGEAPPRAGESMDEYLERAGRNGPVQTRFFYSHDLGRRNQRLVFTKLLGRSLLVPLVLEFLADQSFAFALVRDSEGRLVNLYPKEDYEQTITFGAGMFEGYRLRVIRRMNEQISLTLMTPSSEVLGRVFVSSCM